MIVLRHARQVELKVMSVGMDDGSRLGLLALQDWLGRRDHGDAERHDLIGVELDGAVRSEHHREDVWSAGRVGHQLSPWTGVSARRVAVVFGCGVRARRGIVLELRDGFLLSGMYATNVDDDAH